MKALIAQAKIYNTPPLAGADLATAEEIEQFNDTERLSPEMGKRIMALYNGESIQFALSRKNEYWLLDSYDYYMQNLERFCEPEFDPSEEDAVMARIRTTGIVVTNLKQKLVREDKNEPEYLDFEVVDVGGQRNERKKWMHCFDDVKAVLFIVSLPGYDQVLFEDNTRNRMEEAIQLFETIANNKIFEKTPIFLFFNKKDIFEQMIKDREIKAKFPDYEGGANLRNAMDFFLGKFKAKMPPGKELIFECVSARVKSDIRGAFNTVKKTLYEDNRDVLIGKVAAIKKKQAQTQQKQKDGAKGGCC